MGAGASAGLGGGLFYAPGRPNGASVGNGCGSARLVLHVGTIYLGSAPTATAANRGIEDRRVKLEPGDIFFHPLSITAGMWLPKLAEKIVNADAFILLIGPNGIGPWQTVEYNAAFQRYVEDKQRDERFPLLPATVAASELPGLPFLGTLDRIEAPAGADEVLHRLLAALKGGGVEAAMRLRQLPS